jgi:glycerophosphoryl diester phosphodiesterase
VQNTVRDWKVLPGFIAVGTVIYLITLLTAAAHERGLAVQPWIINEEADLKRILALGVDGINTDNPDRLLELMR